jgi:Protein of unknown function (DUF3592)
MKPSSVARWENKEYRPTRWLGMIVLALTCAVLAGVGTIYFGSKSDSSVSVADHRMIGVMAAILLLVPVLPGLITGLLLFTKRFVITRASITEKSLFGSKTVVFASADSMSRRVVHGKNRTMEVFSITQGKLEIRLDDTIEEYAAIRDFIEASARAEQLARGRDRASIAEKREARQVAAVGAVIATLLIIAACVSAYSFKSKLLSVNELTKTGVRVEGMVSSLGGKHKVWYRYKVGGSSYMQSATEDNAHYAAMQVGGNIGVVYNPDKPEQSTIDGAVDASDARTGLYASYALILLGVALPFLMYRGAKAAAQRASGTPV